MADPTTTAAATSTAGAVAADGAQRAPEERGTLELKDAVVVHVAEQAALSVDGVVRHSSGLDVVTHRDLPRVDADRAGDRVRAAVELAVVWPTPLAPAAQAVRESVRSALADLLGLTVDAVDVTINQILPASAGSPSRRVV